MNSEMRLYSSAALSEVIKLIGYGTQRREAASYQLSVIGKTRVGGTADDRTTDDEQPVFQANEAPDKCSTCAKGDFFSAD